MTQFMIHRDTALGDLGAGLDDMTLLRKVEARAGALKTRIAIAESQAQKLRARLDTLRPIWQNRTARIESRTGARLAYTFESI